MSRGSRTSLGRRNFINCAGNSYQKPVPSSLQCHAQERRKQYVSEKAGVVNFDESCVEPLPTHTYEWSKPGRKSEQAVRDKCSTTATVAMTMSGETAPWLQLIFKGKNREVRADLAKGILQDRTQLTFTESKWQTCDSFAAFVTFIDGFLNPDGGDTPWFLLLDLASIHRATETRAQIPEHIKFAFIVAGATGHAQPQDRAIFRTWKMLSQAWPVVNRLPRCWTLLER